MQLRAKSYLALRGLQVLLCIVTFAVSARHVRGDTAFPFFCGFTGLFIAAAMGTSVVITSWARVLSSWVDIFLSGTWTILFLSAGATAATSPSRMDDTTAAAAVMCFLLMALFGMSAVIAGLNMRDGRGWEPFEDNIASSSGEPSDIVLPVSTVYVKPGTGVFYTPSTLPQQQQQPGVPLRTVSWPLPQHQ